MPALDDLARDPDARQEQHRRRARRRLRGADRRRPARVPAQVPQDGRRPVRVLPRQRLPVLRRRRRARGPLGRRAHRAASGSRATCTPRTTAPTWTPPGVLVFDVNDFDEAYLGPLHLGPAADGRQPRAARLRQGALRRHDPRHDQRLRERLRSSRCARSHSGDRDDEFRLTLDNTEGAVHDVLLRGPARDPRAPARAADRDRRRRAPVRRRARRAPARRRRARRRCSTPTRATSTRSPSSSASTASPTRSRTSSGAAASASAAPGCPPTTCSSRAAARRSRTTSCSR